MNRTPTGALRRLTLAATERGDADALADLKVLADALAVRDDLVAALRAAYSDIQRCPAHTIDMLGRIEAAVAKVEGH